MIPDTGLPDFMAYAGPVPEKPSNVTPLFSCSMTSDEGRGSITITADAVLLGAEAGITRINASEVRSWHSSDAGHSSS